MLLWFIALAVSFGTAHGYVAEGLMSPAITSMDLKSSRCGFGAHERMFRGIKSPHPSLRSQEGISNLWNQERRQNGLRMVGNVGQDVDLATLKQNLLQLCAESKNGLLQFESSRKAEFDSIIEQLIKKSPTQNAAFSPLMSGRWEMKWTSEKEILFLVEKGLFGLKCIQVYQDIDPANGSLANALVFEEDSFLKVQSTFKPLEGKRFEFRFSACSLKWRGLELPLPPVGTGWGDQVYLDSDLRIQRDSRGDMLIAARAA